MHIAVTGAAGRLGSVMCAELVSAGHRVTPLRRADLDIADEGQVATAMRRLRPDVIVNCSAYNAVDAAEANPAEAFSANAQGPAFLTDAAMATGALIVHYGSDFVFDGTAREPYSEDAPTNPLGVYGASKLAGEHEVRRSPRHYVLRVENVFGGCGLNGHRSTIDVISDNLAAGLPVKALVDQTISPSYVNDIVWATVALIERDIPYGTYHCVNSGFATWYELAQEIARQLGVPADIVPVTAADFKSPAPRPLFCALSNRKLLAAGIDIPSWKGALKHHLKARRTGVGIKAAS